MHYTRVKTCQVFILCHNYPHTISYIKHLHIFIKHTHWLYNHLSRLDAYLFINIITLLLLLYITKWIPSLEGNSIIHLLYFISNYKPLNIFVKTEWRLRYVFNEPIYFYMTCLRRHILTHIIIVRSNYT